MPPARPTLYLVDSMSNIHRAYHAIQRLSTSAGRPTNAIYGFVTMLRKMVREHSPDLLAAAWDGPQRTQRHEAYAEYKANRQPMQDDLAGQLPEIREALAAGRSVTVDNLNATRADRAALIALGRELGAIITGYVLETPLADCLARNRSRSGRARVPNVALYTAAKRFEPPALAEGFDRLSRIRAEGGKLVYTALPSGQKEASFTSAQVTDSSLTFENPAHDFPQRIIYRRRGVDALVARIEGPGPNGPRGIDFPMNRVSCTASGS